MDCQICITLDCASKKRVETVMAAVGPDNVNFPDGQSLYMKRVGSMLVLDFKSSDMKKLTGTIDEVLGHIQVVLETTVGDNAGP